MPMNHIMNWRIFFVMVNVFIFCHSRTLTSKEEMPLSGLLSDFKNEGDNIIEKRITKDNCCRRPGYVYYSKILGEPKCVRRLKSVRKNLRLRKYRMYLKSNIFLLGGNLILYKGILMATICPPASCYDVK
ncbi:uncharacterized protein LOC124454341 [Xenia sp. Carnegie-2017]|uniref:uncharacterized protein LOC124454341 n=1 Tax=Xenia sp. Carnegie-2017 TaxID=2897299 RepID=UPI001F038084|nr:uncharacterized protein LOC124454341 [Xenia sp. Carnegie-2017]